jgi:hypothetical protein
MVTAAPTPTPTPTPSPSPSPSPTATPTPGLPLPPLPPLPGLPGATLQGVGAAPDHADRKAPRVKVKVRKQASRKRMMKGVRVRVSVSDRVRLLLRLTRGRRMVARKVVTMSPGTRMFVLRPRRGAMRRGGAARLALLAKVTDLNGVSTRVERRMRIRR